MPKKQNDNTSKYRPPIVTIMGHVDHGKTSILDAIRNSRLTSKESGGITQHIGAYTVEKDGRKITFIDTPGHAAFTQMRARGGSAADIVILVVAADDGVMPQTKEAIMHAKFANVPIIVAINKIDLPGADVKKVKRQLSENEILVEGYGGDVVTVEVSAINGTGIDDLLEVINLIADMEKDRLVADPDGKLEAMVIESLHDPKQGILVNVIVKNGTLRIRDEVISAGIEGKIRALSDSNGKRVQMAIPGDSVEILGFGDLVQVGDILYRKSENPEGKTLVDVVRETENQDIGNSDNAIKTKKLNLIIKADTLGTQEAIVSSILKINVDEAIPNILLAGTGEIKESDVLLASTGKAVIMAFKVKVHSNIKELALSKKVILREHDIIYKLLEEVEAALEGVLEIAESKIKGKGLIIEVFTLPKSGMKVAGTLIESGAFKVNQRVGIFRGESEIPEYVSRIKSIGIGSNEVRSATKGQECGILLKPQFDGIQLDDIIEVL